MPEYLLPFLKCNMQSGSENYQNLYNAIYKHQGFRSLFNHAFQEFDKNLDPKKVVSALGWESFRNRFCSMFVFYLVNEKFPQKTTEVNVAHIIDFENKYRPFSVDGHGRTFLLGLYFTFLDMKNRSDHFKNFMKSDDLYKILNKSRIRELRIDWLIITIYNLMKYYSVEQIEERINEDESYLNFYREFSEQRQQEVTQSYLAYASSIKDDFFFVNSIFDEE